MTSGQAHWKWRSERTERPLFGHVAGTNVGSAKVLERCGFVEVERETTDIEEIVYRLA